MINFNKIGQNLSNIYKIIKNILLLILKLKNKKQIKYYNKLKSKLNNKHAI